MENRVHQTVFRHRMFAEAEVRELAYSEVDGRLYFSSETGLYALESDHLRRLTVSGGAFYSPVVYEIQPSLIYAGLIDGLSLPRRSSRALFLVEDAIQVFDLRTGTFQDAIEPGSDPDSIVDSFLSPNGQAAVYLYEADLETEALLLYDWILHDFETGSSASLLSEPTIRPSEFAGWSHAGAPFFFDTVGRTLSAPPGLPEDAVENVQFDEDLECVRLLTGGPGISGVVSTRALDGNTASYLDMGDLVNPGGADESILRNAFGVEWSPSGDHLLFVRELKTGYVYCRYSVSSDEEEELLPVGTGESIDASAAWLQTDVHFVAACEEGLVFVALED